MRRVDSERVEVSQDCVVRPDDQHAFSAGVSRIRVALRAENWVKQFCMQPLSSIGTWRGFMRNKAMKSTVLSVAGSAGDGLGKRAKNTTKSIEEEIIPALGALDRHDRPEAGGAPVAMEIAPEPPIVRSVETMRSLLARGEYRSVLANYWISSVLGAKESGLVGMQQAAELAAQAFLNLRASDHNFEWPALVQLLILDLSAPSRLDSKVLLFSVVAASTKLAKRDESLQKLIAEITGSPDADVSVPWFFLKRGLFSEAVFSFERLLSTGVLGINDSWKYVTCLIAALDRNSKGEIESVAASLKRFGIGGKVLVQFFEEIKTTLLRFGCFSSVFALADLLGVMDGRRNGEDVRGDLWRELGPRIAFGRRMLGQRVASNGESDAPGSQCNVALERNLDEGWQLPGFDAKFYCQRIGIPFGTEIGMIHRHYIRVGSFRGISPNVMFDERRYLSTYHDVARAVAGREFASGYIHYLLYGAAEGRDPNGSFNEGVERKKLEEAGRLKEKVRHHAGGGDESFVCCFDRFLQQRGF